MASSLRGGIKLTGSGRILFWRRGSVWVGHAGESTDFHFHHAIQITLALSEGKLCLRSPDEDWKEYTAAVVPAHQMHSFRAPGELIALVFVEPESREGQAIRARFCNGISELSDNANYPEIKDLAAAYNDKSTDQHLIACARAVAARLAATVPFPQTPVDKRILTAIDLLHDRLTENVTLADIAAEVHLSPERFRHLFIEQTGIRFRPYILWLRLGSSISAFMAGASLTEASYIGGFADSAHFSRTFKRMFGIAPISFQPE